MKFRDIINFIRKDLHLEGNVGEKYKVGGVRWTVHLTRSREGREEKLNFSSTVVGRRKRVTCCNYKDAL